MQPQSPSPDFDFMLKEDRQAKSGFSLPNLPRPAKISLMVVGGIIVLVIIFSLFSGRKNGSSQALVGAIARGQETLRVTALVQQLQPRDPQTQALAATVSSALSSDQQQFAVYLAKNKIKVSKAQLAADIDKTSDSSLQAASQNNRLDTAYLNYLKSALGKYEIDLQSAYKSAGPNGKKFLSTSFESSSTLLNSAPIKS